MKGDASDEVTGLGLLLRLLHHLDVLGEVELVPDEVEVARLSGFDITIRPLANLTPSDQDTVYGILATATHEELDRLYIEHAQAILGGRRARRACGAGMRFFVRSSEGEQVEHHRFRDAILAAVTAARRGAIAIVGDGDPSEDDDIIEAYDHWRRTYGDKEWSPLPADEVYALLEEVAEPGGLGLEPVRRGLFARRVNADVLQVLRFAPYKGYSYGFGWGVSLAFVPHEFERRVRFHRTFKSAELDLFEDAAEEFVRRGGNEREGFIPASYGADVFRRDAAHAWSVARPRAEEFWASTTTVEAVLARAREQIARPSAGARHWPDPELVAVFALARLGRDGEARAALDEWLATRARDSDRARTVAENLVSAMAKVGTQPQ